jgi:hypothetical protein
MSNFLAINSACVRARCYSLLSNCEPNHRRVYHKLLELWCMTCSLAEDALMDVLCYVVAVMHGTATPFDTRPVGDIASSIV